MFKIECCGHKLMADVYAVVPQKNFKECFLKISRCQRCKKYIAELERIDFDGNKTYIRKQEKSASEFVDKMYHNIMFEVKNITDYGKSNFYLNYSEFGKVKKCYSNLSTLRMGKIHSNFEDVKENKVVRGNLAKRYVSEISEWRFKR